MPQTITRFELDRLMDAYVQKWASPGCAFSLLADGFSLTWDTAGRAVACTVFVDVVKRTVQLSWTGTSRTFEEASAALFTYEMALKFASIVLAYLKQLPALAEND